MANFVHILGLKIGIFKSFFSNVHFGERLFWGATNRMAVRAIVHFGEHRLFWEVTNKSAVTAPQNEHMKKAFRKWQFSHPNREQNWPKKTL